jgi:hypothetical protein
MTRTIVLPIKCSTVKNVAIFVKTVVTYLTHAISVLIETLITIGIICALLLCLFISYTLVFEYDYVLQVAASIGGSVGPYPMGVLIAVLIVVCEGFATDMVLQHYGITFSCIKDEEKP